MIRSAYLIGRILAGLGALLVVAVLIVTAVSFANAGNCHAPDCDDVVISDAVERAFILLPLAVFLGATGVALINDTYRKL